MRPSTGATIGGAKWWMSENAYEPDAGNLIWTDFDPRIGR